MHFVGAQFLVFSPKTKFKKMRNATNATLKDGWTPLENSYISNIFLIPTGNNLCFNYISQHSFFNYEINTHFFCSEFEKRPRECKNGRMAKMRSGLLDAFSSFFLNGLLSVRDFKGLWDSEVTLNFFLPLLI